MSTRNGQNQQSKIKVEVNISQLTFNGALKTDKLSGHLQQVFAAISEDSATKVSNINFDLQIKIYNAKLKKPAAIDEYPTTRASSKEKMGKFGGALRRENGLWRLQGPHKLHWHPCGCSACSI